MNEVLVVHRIHLNVKRAFTYLWEEQHKRPVFTPGWLAGLSGRYRLVICLFVPGTSFITEIYEAKVGILSTP